tara:strand:- start:383 stop:493 length:111 start_codon:yes stop_codon:yes gene_type:complete
LIEIFEIFWSAPIELRTIILAGIVMGGYFMYKERNE